ncbi:hypothetical protein Vadar_005280 [Vaccinium darrowii]|uniref:Uncharacterized protein n=1 Tax=Vaccinium darrowii TaxID=229202 RepID=A0ACB7XPH2_9ERIC|nr:hypothetical protein Vadar_005280 [Vaccinium darrowii]
MLWRLLADDCPLQLGFSLFLLFSLFGHDSNGVFNGKIEVLINHWQAAAGVIFLKIWLVSWNGNNNGLIVEHDAFHVFTESCYTRNFQPVNLKFGFDRKPDLVLGPCDGIFCLYWRANSNFSYDSRDYQVGGVNVERLPTIALWNPATRAFSILPMSKFDFPPYRRVTHCMVGFGFDLAAKSIKVVKLSRLRKAESLQSDFINCAEVYDLSSGSWRVLQLDDMFQEVSVEDELIVSMYNNNDGLFHWYTGGRYFSSPRYPDCDAVVLSFDMSTELFHVTQLPEKYNELSSLSWWESCSFALLGDSLALICSFFVSWFSRSSVSYESHTRVEVWVMKKDFDCMFEAGEPLSSYRWCHELTLESPLPGSCVSTGFWNKNELLIWRDFDHYHYPGLRSARSPFLYDVVTKQARDVEISGELNFMYRESLVSVKEGCGNE